MPALAVLWPKSGQPSVARSFTRPNYSRFNSPGVGTEHAPGRLGGARIAEGVQVSADDELKAQFARLLLGEGRGLLEVVRARPSNADAWEALWLADEAIGAAGEQELAESNVARVRR